MATRSRRSAGGDTGGVNVNLIQLYDLGRLKKELESRGLSIAGKKHELADRLEAAVTGTYTPDVPTPSPKPPRERKSIKKEPSEAVEIKEEPADEKPVVPKKTPKKRARKSKETIEEEEAEEPVATTSEPPVKKAPKVKVELEDEPVPKKKKPRKSVEEAPPPTPVVEACTDAVPEFTDDVPLLSLLAGKKQIKMEDEEEVDEDENAEKPTHSHGTRRAVAMKTPKSKDEPVVERMKFVEISGSDIFDDDDSPDYVQPERSSPPPKESKPRITEEIRAKDKKKKLETRPIKLEPSPVPRKPPVTDLWAQKLAELKKKNETTNALPSPTAVGSKPKIVELKPKPKIPQPTVSVSASSFVLDDILSTHEQQAQEKKRKQEQEELERKEAERRHKEKMAEFRKKQAEDEAKRAEKMKNRPPKPVPEPKTVVELKPHPYARPVSVEEVEKKVEVKAKTTETKSVRRLPPPPPPPPIPGRSVSSSSSVDSPASTSSKTDAKIAPRQRLPPPPPPPPIPKLPAPSKPAEDVDENGTRHDEEKEKPTVAAADSSEGEVDTAAVTMFAEVMLKALKDRQLRAPVSQDEEIEEYDPFVNENGDLDASAYVPSTVGTRNNTMIEEDEEYEEVPSDDEIVGEVEDEEDTDESESEPEEPTSNLSPTKKRAPAGTDGEMEKLLQNPRDLLLKASTVVFSNPTEEVVDPEGPQYIQMPCADDYEPEEEEKKTPEYHGEPVPDDDEIDFFALAAGIQPKKKKEIVIEEEKLPSDESIEPDYYNADLHIKGAADKNYIIEPENADGQALMWGGVRTTYGIRLPFRDVKKEDQDENAPTKKIVFQIKILEFMSTKHLPFEELDPHDVRVGFSLGSTSLILGESLDSYCISSLGKKATNSFFADFVANSVFHLNDVITACLDLEAGTISYWKNDLNLGVAFTNIALPDGDAIFPHICIKNCRVAVNFGGFEGDDEDHPWRKNEEWRFMADLGRGDLIRSRKSPDSKAECTVLMMVGLPGVGKTTWVREYLRDHPEENWTLINHESVLAAMKVNGVSRKRAHQGRWDMIMGLIGKSLQRCVLLAARRRKNYILDMTNTSRETRKKRLQLFEEFRRKCVILMPTDEVMADRQARQARQDGTAQVPPEAMLEMKAVISLPSQEFEPFEDIYFIEPPVNRIQDCIDQINRYNEEARPWFQKKYKRRRSQMIGLGDGIQRNDPMMPRKPMQPLTVLPQLKIAVVPLDDPSNPGPLSASSSHDSAPTSASALGFSVVEDRTPSRPPVHISIDTTIPPPHITPGMKPLVRVTIQDISAPFYRPGDTAQPTIDDQAPELTEQELNQLRDSVKAANPSGNPMMSEAIMRSRLKAMQLKKIEAREGRLPMPIPLSSTPVGNRIPTLGAPISVDTSFSSNSPRGSTSGSFVTPSPSSFSQPPPNISMTSPSIPPPGLMSFNLPPPPISMPPSNVINGSYSWSQNNGN